MDDAFDVVDDLRANGPWRRSGFRRRRRAPTALLILLAGLAALVLASLMSSTNRPNRSTTEKVVVGVLILAIGAFLLSLRRSASRYQS